ncbi:diacylglycerol kinase catalytic domain protein, partial [Opisthorchis viverrini]
MSKVWKAFRTHPKKSFAAIAFTAYGCSCLLDRYNEDILRRRLCDSVKPLGYATIPADHRLRRLTVFLNPFARRGKLLKEFEKNVAPILQLSGLDIHMVYSDNDAEIKDFVSVLDPTGTDGILIASDDHVLQKVDGFGLVTFPVNFQAITALIQRPDFATAKLCTLPVGVVPVGVWNTFAHSLTSSESALQFEYDLLIPVLKERKKRTHVLEISAIQPTDNSPIAMAPNQASPILALSDVNGGASPAPPARQTYALLGLEWSIWRDVELGGGAGASKSKSKPIDTNEHRGLLFPLAAFSPLTWKRHLGVIWRHGLFWITSTNPTSSPNERFPVVQMASEGLVSTAPTPKRRLRVKQAKIVYTPACEGCSKCWDSNIQNEDSSSKGPVKRKSSTFSQLFGLSRVRTQANTNNSGNVEPTEQVEDRSGVVNEECGREYTIELRNVSSVVLALDKNEYYWIDNDHFEACPITARVRRNAISIYQ